MSNSIWKTGYPKYEHDRSWDDIIQEYHREDGSKFYVVGSCSEPNDRWAYLTDIITQADKAERLQKIAERQNDILQDHFATLGYSIGKEVMDMCDEINNQ